MASTGRLPRASTAVRSRSSAPAPGLLRARFDIPSFIVTLALWVGAGVTLLAAVLAGIVFFSEEFARRRERKCEEDTEQQPATGGRPCVLRYP